MRLCSFPLKGCRLAQCERIVDLIPPCVPWNRRDSSHEAAISTLDIIPTLGFSHLDSTLAHAIARIAFRTRTRTRTSSAKSPAFASTTRIDPLRSDTQPPVLSIESALRLACNARRTRSSLHMPLRQASDTNTNLEFPFFGQILLMPRRPAPPCPRPRSTCARPATSRARPTGASGSRCRSRRRIRRRCTVEGWSARSCARKRRSVTV